MPKESKATASFKLTLEVKGSETDTLTWENTDCPLEVIAARQALLLAALGDACKRQASGEDII